MADLDWVKIAIEAASPLISGTIGVIVGAWRGGRRSAQHDQRVKEDYERQIDELRDETRKSMGAYEKAATARNDLFAEQAKEAFAGIRRQIDELRLDTEKRFLPKNDFADWRKEYREDMRDLKESIADIASKH